MHPIRTKENQLFGKRSKQQLFKDGLPSPEDYLGSKTKTILLFRQANAEGEGGDLRDLNSIETNLRFWRRVSSWCYGLANANQMATRLDRLWDNWQEQKDDLDFLKSTLRPFGFVNLDKEGARGTSSKARMKEIAGKEGSLIRQQLEIYQPEAIIACGLGELFGLLRGRIIDAADKTQTKLVGKRRFQEVGFSGQPVCLIEAYHPAQRGKTYEAFAEVVGNFKHVIRNRRLERFAS